MRASVAAASLGVLKCIIWEKRHEIWENWSLICRIASCRLKQSNMRYLYLSIIHSLLCVK